MGLLMLHFAVIWFSYGNCFYNLIGSYKLDLHLTMMWLYFVFKLERGLIFGFLDCIERQKNVPSKKCSKPKIFAKPRKNEFKSYEFMKSTYLTWFAHLFYVLYKLLQRVELYDLFSKMSLLFDLFVVCLLLSDLLW